jgi:membrane protease subunit HflK
MQDAQPPAEVQESFADVIKAREDEESYKNEAKAYANKIKRQAEGTKAKLEQQAAAYKVTVVEQATGETKRFLSILAQFNKSPQIIRMRLYLEAMETVLSNSTKILVDVDKGNNVMLLPLDKLLNSSKEKLPSMPVLPTDNQPTVTAPPATTNTPIDDPRSRGSR